MINWPAKPFLFGCLFQRGPIMVVFNALHEGVEAPPEIGDSEVSFVKVEPGSAAGTRKVMINQDMLVAEVLTKGGKYAECIIPWDAISSMFAPKDGVTMEWPPQDFLDLENDFHDDEFEMDVPPLQLDVIDGDGESATSGGESRAMLRLIQMES